MYLTVYLTNYELLQRECENWKKKTQLQVKK